jgi:hypothetical protein
MTQSHIGSNFFHTMSSSMIGAARGRRKIDWKATLGELSRPILLSRGGGRISLGGGTREPGAHHSTGLRGSGRGIAQIRAWGHRAGGDIEEAFHYQQLQAAHYIATDTSPSFSLVAYEQYLEFSLDGYVLLTLADDQFECGKVGFYVESAQRRIDNLKLDVYDRPATESYPTSMPNY